MKKLIILLLVAGSLAYFWFQYGYLLKSWRDFPSASPVSTAPLDLAPSASSDPSLSFVRLPADWSISYFARDVPGARSLAIGGKGVVYVGTRPEGVVYALVDTNGDGSADRRYVVASGLNHPNGVAYHNGTLYVAEIQRIIKFAHIDSTYDQSPTPEVVYDQLPTETHHGWRYLAVGPDQRLYVGIGVPCNVCEVQDPFGTIASLNLDGSDFRVVARGIRNTVGFDWSPADQSLWFTDNGRDLLGDDIPADELNHVRDTQEHFGFPHCHENALADPKFGRNRSCNQFFPPVLELSPHGAALGMKFVGDKIFIAEHGSWNRKVPIGYRLIQTDVSGGVASNYRVLADGWLESDGTVRGRPVDILVLPDHSLLVSDDFADAVYRLTPPLSQ